jgi:hypothetical protein
MRVSFYNNAGDGLLHFKAVFDDKLTTIDRPAVLPDDQVAWPLAFDHFTNGTGAGIELTGNDAVNDPMES